VCLVQKNRRMLDSECGSSELDEMTASRAQQHNAGKLVRRVQDVGMSGRQAISREVYGDHGG